MASDSMAMEAEAKLPISLHRAFPAVVALWFAALLGMGSLMLPAILLERAIGASHLAAVVPAAAPPLGFTAHAAIAVVAALVGAGFGLAIARRLASAHAPGAASRFSPAARRPFSAHDELGDEGIGTGARAKRRSLAMAENDRPSDFLMLAPLPGEDAYAVPAAAALPDAADEPLELHEVAAEIVADAAVHQPAAPPPTDDDAMPFQEPVMTDDAPVPFPLSDELERRRAERRAAVAPSHAPEGLERRLYLRRTGDEPIAFIAPSLARRAPVNENAAAEAAASSVAVKMNFAPPQDVRAEEPGTIASAPPVFDSVDTGEETHAWEDAPLAELGMAQLVQRLGASIERRRELAAMAPAAPPAEPAPAPVPVFEEEAAPAEEAAEAMAAYFGRGREEAPAAVAEPEGVAPELDATPGPAAQFGALASIEEDEHHDDDDLAASFSLPLRRAPVAHDPFPDFDEPAAADADDADYGSLLALRNPFHTRGEEFVRVEEPLADDEGPMPTVVFPGRAELSGPRAFDPPAAGAGSAAFPPAAVANGEADEALRRAHAILQRMNHSA